MYIFLMYLWGKHCIAPLPLRGQALKMEMYYNFSTQQGIVR